MCVCVLVGPTSLLAESLDKQSWSADLIGFFIEKFLDSHIILHVWQQQKATQSAFDLWQIKKMKMIKNRSGDNKLDSSGKLMVR